jgi:glycosyltransferase involved in cell wall biosynthesis
MEVCENRIRCLWKALSQASKSMKILHLNTFEQAGGAAKSAYRLHRALLDAGVDSRMLVKQRDSAEETTDLAVSEKELDSQLDLIQKFYVERYNRPNPAPFTHPFAATSLTTHPWVEEADLIHLHWVSRLVNPEDVLEFRAKGKRVVWTLHDMWPLTGGCHYSGQCRAFQSECVDCPILEQDPSHFVNWSFRIKHSVFSRAVDAVICPSRWIAGMARISATFAKVPRFNIPYCLDLDTFHPESKKKARAELSLPQDKILVLFCAYASSAPRKGLQSFLSALDHIARTDQGREIHVLFAGAGSEGIQVQEVSYTAFGFVNEPGRLRTIYSAADCSVHPTLGDNLPNAIIESLSCGTPAIAFDTGGVADLVKDGITGFLVDAGDVRSLANRILALGANGALIEKLSQNAREFAENNFQPAKVAQAYVEVYNRVSENPRPTWSWESYTSSLMPLRVLTSSVQGAKDNKELLRENFEHLQSTLADASRQIEELNRYVNYLKASSRYERPIRDFIWRMFHPSDSH